MFLAAHEIRKDSVSVRRIISIVHIILHYWHKRCGGVFIRIFASWAPAAHSNILVYNNIM